MGVAGLVAGIAGLAVSYLASMALAIRESPVVAVGEAVIQLVPGAVIEPAIDLLGHYDKPVLVATVVVLLGVAFVLTGLAARVAWWRALVLIGVVVGIGLAAVMTRNGATPYHSLPSLLGLVAWIGSLAALTRPLQQPERTPTGRRGFLFGLIGVGAVTAAAVVVGNLLASARKRIERSRQLLKLTQVTEPEVDGASQLHLDGVTAFQTPNDEFYLIHTAIVVPTIEPDEWRLRIHGLVDNPLELSYADLVEREFTEAWITLNCVSNSVGGDLIGNAWWSGVRLADLLAEAGVSPEADAILQTSEDGWTCGTPLAAVTDDRNAMLAVAMNGEPLPIDHGFPVRTIVPGLYGFVSACKWVVDIEVTRFDRFEAYWTGKGWSEQAPVKLSSRIDVPSSGDSVTAGTVRVGGVAWAQHTGIQSVEVALDGGRWQPAALAGVPSDDTWVQWVAAIEVPPGDHLLRVRATDKAGTVQTGVQRDVAPDGATGWHEIDFTATED